MDYIKDLLNKLNSDYSKIDTKEDDNNYEPNIFEILQIENKEVLFCRLLGSLLDPASKINNGSTDSLIRFAKECDFGLENDITKASISISLEEKINEDRRVDIVIRINDKVYPIEVKINAEDQKHQLYDYWHFYFDEKQRKHKNQNNKIIYYLTPTGKEPSKESITAKDNKTSLEQTDYKLISFNKEITKWLKSINYYKNETANYILGQYKRTVEKMCENEEKKSALYKVIGFDNGNNTDINKYNELLITILNNSEDISKKIKQNYLVEKFGNIAPLKFCKIIDDEDYEKDTHCLLAIKKDDKKIAWICADTNLYIVAEKIKEGKIEANDWKTTEIENYIWKHIDNGSKRFDIGKNINRCLDNDVNLNNIKVILDDIET